ncbi:MAG: NADPH-dependent FMN reductase [Nitritalea sp.]
MILLIVGTNRKQALSNKIAAQYREILVEQGAAEVETLALEELPADFAFSALYEYNGKNPAFNALLARISAAEKYVFIVPEYNGSFPGVLKTFIDGMSYPNGFRDKKCALVGLSSGIGGAGIALSHLTDIFHYLGMHVLAQKPKLAQIERNMQEDRIQNPLYLELLQGQAKALLQF